MRPLLSVVIAANDHPPPPARVIGGFFGQSAAAGDFEVILVDARDSPDFRRTLWEFQQRQPAGPAFAYEVAPGKGRAHCLNTGLKRARGALVLFFADDFIAAPGLVAAHLAFHRDHPEPTAVGIGAGLLPRANTQDIYLAHEASGELFGAPMRTDMTGVPAGFFYVANSSAKKTLVDQCGPFDESFPFFCWDDYEMGLRMAQQGMQPRYVPGATAEHDHALTLPERCRSLWELGYSARIHELKYPQDPRSWNARLRDPALVWRWRALRSRLQLALTGNPEHLRGYEEARLRGSFVQGHAAARAQYCLPADPGARLPRISVVLPAYNGARYLRAQLDSILAQTCGDFELIAVDDASSDGSYAILEEYARRDGRIVLSRNLRNLGLLGNLAALFRRARAPWIAVSDQDDVWHPRKLEKLLACAQGKAAAYCNSELIDARGERLGLTIMEAIGVATPASGRDPLLLLWDNCVSGHAMLFRRELCAGFLPFWGDMPYDQQIAIHALAGGGLAYCPEALIQHRLHDSNLCNHSLPRRPVHDGKPHAPAPPKLTVPKVRRRGPAEKLRRRSVHRRKLADRFTYFAHKRLIPPHWRQVLDSDRIDRKWFDAGMFALVLRHPGLFTEHVQHRRLRVAFKFARGAAWYRTVHAWRQWLALVTRA